MKDDTRSETSDETHEGVLSPEDLELEETKRIDNNRHVVPVGEDGKDVEAKSYGDGCDSSGTRDSSETQKAYGMEATVRTPDGEATFETASNDVTEFFEDFLRWYLSQIANDEDPGESLRVLVESSSL